MRNFESKDFSYPPKQKMKKTEKKMGEYIDYEEID